MIESQLGLNPDEEVFAPTVERERFLIIVGNFVRGYVKERIRLEREATFLRTLQQRRGLDTARRAVIDVDGPEYEATLENVLKSK